MKHDREGKALKERHNHLDSISHALDHGDLISVENMSFRYPDGTLALEKINLKVSVGSSLAVIGPNGGGKTTLLKILLGLLDGYSGKVRVAGMTPREARRRGDVVSWVPQRSNFNWAFPVTLRETVQMGLMGRTGLLRRPSRADKEYLDRVLRVLEIDGLAERPIGGLSGGQQQRALVARALVPRPLLLMLDEPGVGIDAAGTVRLREALTQIRREFEITLVTVSHDLRLVVGDSERVACLNRKLHFHDAPKSLSDAVLSELFSCCLDGVLPGSCPQDQDDGEH